MWPLGITSFIQRTSFSPLGSLTTSIPGGMVSAARSGMPTGTGVSDTNTGGPWFGHSSTKYSWQDSQTADVKETGVRYGRHDAQHSGQLPVLSLAQLSPLPRLQPTHTQMFHCLLPCSATPLNTGSAPTHTSPTNTCTCLSPGALHAFATDG